MGCVSSKLFKKELREETNIINSSNNNNGGGVCDGEGKSLDHVVSLTSSTYGALRLEKNDTKNKEDREETEQQQKGEEEGKVEQNQEPIKEVVADTNAGGGKVSPPRRSNGGDQQQKLEVINAWELMEGLEEQGGVQLPRTNQGKKNSPKTRALLRGLESFDARSPLKFLNQIGSPRKAKTFGGKENKVKRVSDFSPRPIFKGKENTGKPCSKAVAKLSFAARGFPVDSKDSSGSSSSTCSSRRRSFSPLFDPELVALYERELTEEEEQIKRVVSLTPKQRNQRNLQISESLLQSFELKCPPGGENAVVIYTTTLRGIRKTFEDCNTVRSIVESHDIHVIERDISMDSGFKEELRRLMGKKDAKVPLVFVKGRIIGGADQLVKLEEEGKLSILFNGIPRGLIIACEGCGGIRFLMCTKCNGSCKVLDQEQKLLRCGNCNENGLIQCPLCC